METKAYVLNEFSNRQKHVVVHDTETLNFQARLAINLLERWAMVTAHAAGEDSAGRHISECMPPSDVVSRACDIAQATEEEFRRRGWFVHIGELYSDEDLAAK